MKISAKQSHGKFFARWILGLETLLTCTISTFFFFDNLCSEISLNFSFWIVDEEQLWLYISIFSFLNRTMFALPIPFPFVPPHAVFSWKKVIMFFWRLKKVIMWLWIYMLSGGGTCCPADTTRRGVNLWEGWSKKVG